MIPLTRNAVCLAAIVACSALAQADERSEAKEHYVKGTKAFELGAYDEAIAEYSLAYRIRDDSALLFNIAQAHRLAAHPVEAVRFYRMFLLKNPNARNREEIEGWISDLQKRIDEQKQVPIAPPAPPRSATPVVPAPSSNSSAASAPQVPPAPSPPLAVAEDRGRPKRIAGLAVGAAGIAIIGGGIALGVLASHAGDTLTKLDQTMQPFDYNQQQQGQTYQILEGVFLGIGAAAVVAGTVVYIIGRGRRTTPSPASLAQHVGRTAF